MPAELPVERRPGAQCQRCEPRWRIFTAKFGKVGSGDGAALAARSHRTEPQLRCAVGQWQRPEPRLVPKAASASVLRTIRARPYRLRVCGHHVTDVSTTAPPDERCPHTSEALLRKSLPTPVKDDIDVNWRGLTVR